MSIVKEIFGDKVEAVPARPAARSGEEKTAPRPTVHARDLISEARKVQKFVLAEGVAVAGKTQAAEEFRALRTNLLTLKATKGLGSIVLSSCHHREGKTTTAINLALFMAKSPHRKVLLLEGDLRRPNVKECLSLPIEAGVEDVLTGKAKIGEALFYSEEDNLAVLPVRSGHADAAERLDSPAMEKLMPLLLASFDHVICDGTPLLSTTDPCVLGSRMGGVALVVRAGVTQRESVEHAMLILEQAGIPFIGLILNHVRFYVPHYLYRYQYYHDDYYGDSGGAE